MAPGFAAQVIADARAAAKDYARVALDAEDGVIDALAAAALAMAEAFLGVAIVVRAHRAVLPVTGAWQLLPVGPVMAIDAVRGIPAEGAAFDLPVDAYAIDVDAEGDGWVRVTRPGAAGRVEVSFVAGIAEDWAGLPGPIAHGVVRLIAHLHGERDGAGAPVPAAVSALWRPFRRVRLAETVR